MHLPSSAFQFKADPLLCHPSLNCSSHLLPLSLLSKAFAYHLHVRRYLHIFAFAQMRNCAIAKILNKVPTIAIHHSSPSTGEEKVRVTKPQSRGGSPHSEPPF